MDIAQWAWGRIRYLRAKLFTDEERISSLERKVKAMADILDTTKSDFETFRDLAIKQISDLSQKITDITAGQLDPAKAQAIDDEIKAAIAALTPPAA